MVIGEFGCQFKGGQGKTFLTRTDDDKWKCLGISAVIWKVRSLGSVVRSFPSGHKVPCWIPGSNKGFFWGGYLFFGTYELSFLSENFFRRAVQKFIGVELD